MIKKLLILALCVLFVECLTDPVQDSNAEETRTATVTIEGMYTDMTNTSPMYCYCGNEFIGIVLHGEKQTFLVPESGEIVCKWEDTSGPKIRVNKRTYKRD